MKTQRLLSSTSLSFVHQRTSFEEKENWRFRTEHITLVIKKAKCWKRENFFYPVEVKVLIVIYIIVNISNNKYVEQNHLCVQKKIICSHGVRSMEKSLKNNAIKLDENETSAPWWVFPACLRHQDTGWNLKVINLTVRKTWHWEQSVLITSLGSHRETQHTFKLMGKGEFPSPCTLT